MRPSIPVYQLKRRAKRLSRDHDIPLHEALDRVAAADGFRGWGHLASTAPWRGRPSTGTCASRNGAVTAP